MKKIILCASLAILPLFGNQLIAQEALPDDGYELRTAKCPNSEQMVNRCVYVNYASSCDPSQQELCD
jgi:hypothetical protein